MSGFNQWLQLAVQLQRENRDATGLSCPNCKTSKVIAFQYVGDPEKRIGYLDLWCTHCLHGIHMSRVLIPEGSEMLPFGSELIESRIPNFIRAEPVSSVSG